MSEDTPVQTRPSTGERSFEPGVLLAVHEAPWLPMDDDQLWRWLEDQPAGPAAVECPCCGDLVDGEELLGHVEEPPVWCDRVRWGRVVPLDEVVSSAVVEVVALEEYPEPGAAR